MNSEFKKIEIIILYYNLNIIYKMSSRIRFNFNNNCENINCNKIATWGKPSNINFNKEIDKAILPVGIPKKCKIHANIANGDRDLCNKLCGKCYLKQPYFGFKNCKAIRCYNCKKDNMINIYRCNKKKKREIVESLLLLHEQDKDIFVMKYRNGIGYMCL